MHPLIRTRCLKEVIGPSSDQSQMASGHCCDLLELFTGGPEDCSVFTNIQELLSQWMNAPKFQLLTGSKHQSEGVDFVRQVASRLQSACRAVEAFSDEGQLDTVDADVEKFTASCLSIAYCSLVIVFYADLLGRNTPTSSPPEALNQLRCTLIQALKSLAMSVDHQDSTDITKDQVQRALCLVLAAVSALATISARQNPNSLRELVVCVEAVASRMPGTPALLDAVAGAIADIVCAHIDHVTVFKNVNLTTRLTARALESPDEELARRCRLALANLTWVNFKAQSEAKHYQMEIMLRDLHTRLDIRKKPLRLRSFIFSSAAGCART